MILTQTCGYLLADAAGDAMIVQRAQLEEREEAKYAFSIDLTDSRSYSRRGDFQTYLYTIRSVGSVVGTLMSALLFNKHSWGWGLSIAQVPLFLSLCLFVDGDFDL